MYKEPFRPQFHYSPPCRWMNDPNGMVYVDGEYHLFYQFHPFSETWGPMHWGHAVSPDLIHWETLPIALYPDDNGPIWSGSAVIDVNNTSGFGENAMVAIFSFQNQTQGVAYSHDNGRTWTKYEGNPVLPAVHHDFRDPKVFWHEPTGRWAMVISAGREVLFFTSTNLTKWDYASNFSGGHQMSIWEVPDLFPLTIDGETKWVLLVSVGDYSPAGGNGIQYFIGDFDGERFSVEDSEQILWMDYGSDNYAGTTWSNAPDGRILYIGWMSNWKYADRTPTSTWRGANTLVRELTLVHTSEGIRLQQTPIAPDRAQNTPLGVWDDIVLDGDYPLEGIEGRLLDITLEIEPGTASEVGLRVHDGANEPTTIAIEQATSELVVRRTDQTGPGEYISDFTRVTRGPLPIEGDTVTLRIFVDESSVEIFANDGMLVISNQTFSDPQNTGITLFANGGTATVRHMEIDAVPSIWEGAEIADYDFCQ